MAEIRRIIRFVKPYWKLALISFIMLLLMVASDLSIPRLIERIIDNGIKQKDMNVVLSTAVLMLGISIINTIVAILNNNYSVQVGESVARDLRQTLFEKIQQFSYGDLDRYSTGKLMVRLTSDTSAVQRLVQVTLRIGTRAPLNMIGSIILMFVTSSQLAMSMIPLLVITSIVIVFFSIKMEPLFRTVQQKLDWLNTVLQENIAGARLVKAFVRADYEGERFEKANEELTDRTARVMQFMSTMGPVLTIFVNVGMVVVIWRGGLEAIQGKVSLGQIVAFTNYLLTTMTPLIMMTQLSNTWANGLASARRIFEVLDIDPEVSHVDSHLILPVDVENSIQMDHVDFIYRGNSKVDVLDDISLSARPGDTIAILGATGAGKSSLVNLIPRFYDATAGTISLGGHNVKEIQEGSLLERVGIVPQETILFSGTVRENICYGKPDATDEEVIRAAKIAQAHEFILSFRQGYDTHIEERGANLSGGQKQRIAIARALVTRPRILILDDSTSAVDVETETHIQDAMKQEMATHTNFVVAQRISTVINADKIIVLDRGRIVANGNHAELLQTSSVYREIYDSQLGNGFNHDGEGRAQ
jgi:ATP-binding cassette subfamily B protein